MLQHHPGLNKAWSNDFAASNRIALIKLPSRLRKNALRTKNDSCFHKQS